jgi:acyl-CoA synthetase (NDP forming)
MDTKTIAQFESIFFPGSIAVVGASGDERKMGTVFLRDLFYSEYKGKLYAVDRVGESYLGLKVHRSISEIPGPVDYVIVAIPKDGVLDLLDDCGEKGVRAVHFFTAGFSELGNDAGIKLEFEILEKSRRYGFRIIGPNSIGIYSRKANMLANGGAADFGDVGNASLISQSGSVVQKVIQNGTPYGLCFNKVASIGNACDLDCNDYIEYLGADMETQVIGAYLEGIKDGQRFLRVAREITKNKPLIVWKGGKTDAGARAAASHTASMTIQENVWTAALKQAGAVKVDNLSELVDTMIAFQKLPVLKKRGVAIVSGMLDGGGGESVAAADACIGAGLEVPLFSEWTLKQLEFLLGRVGSILHNPLDVSQSLGNIEVIQRAVELASNDDNVSLVIIQERIDLLVRLASIDMVDRMTNMFLELNNGRIKPLVVVLERGMAEEAWKNTIKAIIDAEIPVFPNLERAAKAIANVCEYADYRKNISNNT